MYFSLQLTIYHIEKAMESALNGDPNIKDKCGRTALMYASEDGDIEKVELLLDRGSDPNIVSPFGITALIHASFDGHTEIVELLLDRGADINFVRPFGRTAIMFATDRGHRDIVKLMNDHNDRIALQNALQNLAFAKSMNSLTSPLECLDYDIMQEIMICTRTYNHGVHMRMKV